MIRGTPIETETYLKPPSTFQRLVGGKAGDAEASQARYFSRCTCRKNIRHSICLYGYMVHVYSCVSFLLRHVSECICPILSIDFAVRKAEKTFGMDNPSWVRQMVREIKLPCWEFWVDLDDSSLILIS